MFEWILEFVWCIFPFRLNRKAVKTCDAHYQEITLLPKKIKILLMRCAHCL